MPPTIAFAEPDKVGAIVQPGERVSGTASASSLGNIDPGVVMVPENLFGGSRLRVGRKDDRVVLPPVQLTDGEPPVTRPIHAEQVVLARIAGNFDPDRRTA